jgi:hypothetical protein
VTLKDALSFEPRCLATAIGSLPHNRPQDAVRVILDSIPDAPPWPQLPASSFRERMDVQCSEGLPRVVIDAENQRMFIDTSGQPLAELDSFHERVAAGDVDSCRITPAFSAGIPAMLAALQATGSPRPFVKVQAIGPITFGLTVTDETGRAIYHSAPFIEAIVKVLAMKCRWQVRQFAKFAERVICFIDEPTLSVLGPAARASVTRDSVVSKLSQVVGAVHAETALAGVHCCGNTDWSTLIDAGADIVSFDAFDFGESIALYPEAVKRHLERGGALAWGIVPTTRIQGQTAAGLADKFSTLVDHLAKAARIDRDLIERQALITPSCGAGCLSVSDAERVSSVLRETSAALRARLYK